MTIWAPLWWKSVLTTSISDGVLKANDGDNYNSFVISKTLGPS
jgi:hypothetical protein